MNFQRFLFVMKKEFIQIKRDKASLIISIIMPVMMILLFGYAVNTELDNINTAVMDMSNTKESKDIIKNFENTKYFQITERTKSYTEIDKYLDEGKVHSAIIIPADYALKLKEHEKTNVKILIDGSDATTARTILNAAVLSGEKYNKIYINKNAKKDLNSGGINISTKVLYNPDLKNKNFTIPGLVGLILQNITILLTAFAIVREKERGTIEQLIVSPLRPMDIILGKLAPYVFIGFFDFLLAMFFGFDYFGVPISGSLPLLIFLGLGFVICSLAIGILISTTAKTQLQAMQMTFMILLPSVLLSGFIFPREAMPKIINAIGYFIPLTYFLNIVRGIVLKGVGISYIYKDVIVLLIFGIVLLGVSIFRFKRNLE
ncbi:ABC-2 type transport system permease protein [Clostridium acidisoli DSM 12555]|uniref:ABC-2 type transport system permease protein n=1 Tax=Clostridium acidisoli DSM 12555 TaxID=1121291 RepID=A0A1W1XT48_9CLOT|nr:ABC transporter permease [Clostridium acidisoli]SMC27150.1 ABC-2 type transport system permease protein [Clostridium acidisoli DSM 12555]